MLKPYIIRTSFLFFVSNKYVMELGILGPEDHDVFGQVADVLEDRDVSVDFLSPETYHSPDDLEAYDGIFLKKSRKPGFQTLRDAEREGIPTFNGFRTHMKTNHNPGSYWHLEQEGLEVPEGSSEGLEGDTVVKPRTETMREEPWREYSPKTDINHFYQRFIENGGIDYKLYVTDLPDKTTVRAISADSKLLYDQDDRTQVETDAEIQEIGERCIKAFDARILGIDLIRPDSGTYVVDINAAPSYRGTDDEAVLADSLEAFLYDEF